MIGRRPSSEGTQGVTELSSTADAPDRDIKGQISMEEHKCEHNDISYPKGIEMDQTEKMRVSGAGGSDRASQRRADLQSY